MVGEALEGKREKKNRKEETREEVEINVFRKEKEKEEDNWKVFFEEKKEDFEDMTATAWDDVSVELLDPVICRQYMKTLTNLDTLDILVWTNQLKTFRTSIMSLYRNWHYPLMNRNVALLLQI